MKTIARCFGFVLALLPAAMLAQQPPAPAAPPKEGFTLSSPAFPDGGEIPVKYTGADPKPVSPKLEWRNVPAGTVTFVLMLRDPDVAMQRTTEDNLHSSMVNIPGTLRELPEGVPTVAQLPDGTIQPKGRRQVYGYIPPGAPAPGPHHHYTWELYALDTKLDLNPDTAMRADIVKAMDGHVLGKAVLVGRFHR